MKKIYLIGSLSNSKIPVIAKQLRSLGFDVFDDWISPGKDADREWQKYEKVRGRSYKEALYGRHAQEVFDFDLKHLQSSDIVVMVAPCGKSGHLELGWAVGQGKTSYVLFDGEPDKYDIMYAFCTDIFFHMDELCRELKERNSE